MERGEEIRRPHSSRASYKLCGTGQWVNRGYLHAEDDVIFHPEGSSQ